MRKRRRRLPSKQKSIPLLIFRLFLPWVLPAIIILFISPTATGAIPAFLAVLALAAFLTLLPLLKNPRRSAAISLSFTAFLILRFFKVGNILNLFLLTASLITFEIYYSKKP